MATKFEEVEYSAKEMVEVFKAHAKTISVRSDVSSDEGQTQSYVSDLGLAKLSDKFGEVPIGYRAAVYSMFVDLLEREGIIYDVTQFGGTVH